MNDKEPQIHEEITNLYEKVIEEKNKLREECDKLRKEHRAMSKGAQTNAEVVKKQAAKINKLKNKIDLACYILNFSLENSSSFTSIRNHAIRVLNEDIDTPEEYS